MSRRVYELRQQVLRSQQIREAAPPSWQEFLTIWAAFNALYNLSEHGSEVQKIDELLAKISAELKGVLIVQLVTPEKPIPYPPPGDMRFSDDDPKFRQASMNSWNVINDQKRPNHDRLAALLRLIYQIRCNITHGAKHPEAYRDNELVGWGLNALRIIVPMMEEGLLRSPN